MVGIFEMKVFVNFLKVLVLHIIFQLPEQHNKMVLWQGKLEIWLKWLE